jgi:hypothetical protein
MPPILLSDSSRKPGIPEQDQRYAISHAAVVQMIDRDVLLIVGHPDTHTHRRTDG